MVRDTLDALDAWGDLKIALCTKIDGPIVLWVAVTTGKKEICGSYEHTPREAFDSLLKRFEGNAINQYLKS